MDLQPCESPRSSTHSRMHTAPPPFPACTSPGPVARGPEQASWQIRCTHTASSLVPPAFRILSYNILADQYAGSDYAQNVRVGGWGWGCVGGGGWLMTARLLPETRFSSQVHICPCHHIISLYHTIPHHTAPYHTIPHHTTPRYAMWRESGKEIYT